MYEYYVVIASAAEEKQSDPPRLWQEKLAHPFVIAVIGALVGAGSALFVAGIGATVTVQTVQQQLQAEREKEHREKTPVAYSSYLDAAKRYRTAQLNLAVYTRQEGLQDPDVELARAKSLSDPTAKELLTATDAAASTYESAVSSLAVYGSDAAWEIHQRIAAKLRPGKVLDADGDGVDESHFDNYMDDLRIEFCETVSLKGETCQARRLAPDFLQVARDK